MKFSVSCSECEMPTKGEIPDDAGAAGVGRPFVFVSEIRDDGIYDTTCPRGHRGVTVLQNAKWEILFDSGALAMRDGYLREAVASIAAALEDFFLYYARIVLRAHKVPAETIAAFAGNARQSERRLGAMHMAYALETGKPFAIDDTARRNFRNKVIHDGYWPTKAQAEDYVRYAYDAIQGLAYDIGVAHPDAEAAEEVAPIASAHTLARARETSSKSKGARVTRRGTSAVMTLLGYTMGKKPRPFDDAFRDWSSWNVWDLARELEDIEASVGAHPNPDKVADDPSTPIDDVEVDASTPTRVE